ncbi:DUF1232 domain-containing protein [Methanobrevibacter sp.]|uniref:DUF1232 domain-containing protein n=1 Tax=Methanobrevibacter sp. TaxID=66852 RepID=UPI003863A1C1
MTEYLKDYYDTLIENLNAYAGEYDSFINHGPNLYKLLCDILEQDIPQNLRKDICGAIAYYVIPRDVIPEHIYGPQGYVDDVYLSVYVLKLVAEECGYEFIQKIWDKPEDVKDVMAECESKALEILKDDEIEAILSYVGFK